MAGIRSRGPPLLTWRRVLRDGLILYLGLAALRLLVVDVYHVPSGSMRPTLIEGDYLLVNRLAYGVALSARDLGLSTGPALGWRWRVPNRGDVILFRHPRDPDLVVVKRVVGLPGDRVAAADGRLVLNGTPVARRAAGATPTLWRECASADACYIIRDGEPGPVPAAVTVADRHLYVLGDDRPGSLDSRLGWQVPVDTVLGRADRVIWSMDPASADGWTAWMDRWRADRLGVAIR